MSSGTITAISGTVGSSTKPVYLSSGTITASSSTVGSSTKPVYLSSGTITACPTPVSGTWFGGVPNVASDGVMEVGRYIDFHYTTDTTGDYSVRLSINSDSKTSVTLPTVSGELLTHTSGSAVGGSTTPVYISSTGVATACSAFMPIAGSTFTGVAYAQTNTSYTTYQLRNIAFVTSAPSSLTNGGVAMVYTA